MYKRRSLFGIKGRTAAFADITEASLSSLLESCTAETLFLCGDPALMTRDYVMEAVETGGWELSRKYIASARSAFLSKQGRQPINVKHSREWFPKLPDAATAADAWAILEMDWKKRTGFPPLSSPAKTGQGLLWQTLPKGLTIPELPEETANLIRFVSPQHRYEKMIDPHPTGTRKYDGRWMYAALASLDRLPIGEPISTKEFKPFVPGWYRIEFVVPKTWNHIGLLPVKAVKGGTKTWVYPSRFDGEIHETWATEPELALAQEQGWNFEILEGFQFPQKGRPLCEWQKVLVDMRNDLSQVDEHAASAARQILNAGIGQLHRNDYDREMIVSTARYKELCKERGIENVFRIESYDDGQVKISIREKATDKLSIYLPHWSSQIYAMERARIARHCLQIDPAAIVEIRGDAIYTTADAPWKDNGNLGQIRFQGVDTE